VIALVANRQTVLLGAIWRVMFRSAGPRRRERRGALPLTPGFARPAVKLRCPPGAARGGPASREQFVLPRRARAAICVRYAAAGWPVGGVPLRFGERMGFSCTRTTAHLTHEDAQTAEPARAAATGSLRHCVPWRLLLLPSSGCADAGCAGLQQIVIRFLVLRPARAPAATRPGRAGLDGSFVGHRSLGERGAQRLPPRVALPALFWALSKRSSI